MGDNVAPLALSFTPAAAAREVALDLQGAQITFNEPLFLISGSEARLMRLDSASGEVDTYREVQKLSLSMSSTGAEVEHLLIALGPLDPDSVYSITIPSGALVDRANNAFVGVQVGEWAFRSTIKPQVVESNAGDFPPGAIAGIIAAAVLLIAIAITGIACQRWKLVAKFEDRKTRPMEGATPKASQVKALENDTELLPSNEKYWQKALVRTQELGNGLDPELDTDGLEELPRDIPGTVNSRRPSNVSCGSNNPSNHRRPSNVSCGSNNPSNHRRPSNVSGGSNNPSNHRRPSNIVNGHSNHPSNRPNSKLSAGSQRRPSKNSADAAASSCLRQLALEGKSEVRSRSPSVDVSNASRSGRTQEEASNLAANRLAMLGAGPATLPIPHRSRSPAPRNIVT
ncbi:unnamed protein product [Effrenium voratum]|nr:unnamed protein product [Effrenium voratum]